MMRWTTRLGFGLGLAALLAACDLGLGGEDGRQAAGSSCGGFAGLQCDSASFCDFAPADHCGAADATGVCVRRPSICTLNYAPVIGCDGHQYSNACAAHSAGTDDAERVAQDAP